MDQPWCVASKQLTDYSSPTVVLNVSKETHSPTKVVLREISLRRGAPRSQDAKSSIWYKHKLTAWWRHNLMQLWESYAWDAVTPHILQCCRDFFFPRKCHLKHIYNWTQQRLWNWTGTAHLFEFFGKHFAGFLFVLFASFLFCINFYQSMQLQCPRWRMHNKPYFLKKKKRLPSA